MRRKNLVVAKTAFSIFVVFINVISRDEKKKLKILFIIVRTMLWQSFNSFRSVHSTNDVVFHHQRCSNANDSRKTISSTSQTIIVWKLLRINHFFCLKMKMKKRKIFILSNMTTTSSNSFSMTIWMKSKFRRMLFCSLKKQKSSKKNFDTHKNRISNLRQTIIVHKFLSFLSKLFIVFVKKILNTRN